MVVVRVPFCGKVAVCVLVLAVGLTSFSGFVSPVYAAHHGGHGGHHGGGGYSYGGGYAYSWYYPYYYSCPYYYGSYCSSYYGSYYSSPSQYQLTVNTDPSSLGGQATGGGSYNSGVSASFSAPSMVQSSKDTRYVFTGWKGDFSGSGVSGSVTMDASKTVTAGYQLQYYLTVNTVPSNVPSVQGSGWYNVGDVVPFSVPSQSVSVGSGVRFVFSGWSVDGNSQGSTLSLQMSAPHVVTAQFKQQFFLKVLSDQGVSSGEGWYDAGSYAQFSVSTPSSPSFGVSLVFNGWQGDVQSLSQSSRVLMDGPKMETATWRTDATVLYATIAGVIIAIALVAVAAFFSSQRKRGMTTTMLCAQCGKSFRPGTNYCVSCGTPRNISNNANRPATTQNPATS